MVEFAGSVHVEAPGYHLFLIKINAVFFKKLSSRQRALMHISGGLPERGEGQPDLHFLRTTHKKWLKKVASGRGRKIDEFKQAIPIPIPNVVFYEVIHAVS